MRDKPEMDDVVELSDGGVPDLGPCEAVLALNLRAKVPQKDDGGLVGTKEKGSNEEVGGREGGGVAAGGESEPLVGGKGDSMGATH